MRNISTKAKEIGATTQWKGERYKGVAMISYDDLERWQPTAGLTGRCHVDYNHLCVQRRLMSHDDCCYLQLQDSL